MEIISSLQNPLIKETKKLQQKKYRDIRKEFLVEGVRLVEEGLKAGSLSGAFYEEDLLAQERGRLLVEELSLLVQEKALAYCVQVAPPVLQSLAETRTPQGIVAVARQKEAVLGEATATAAAKPERGLLLVVDGVSDPGNFGTLIRTAWAAGAEAVVCLQGTADCYNAKTIRATMGAVFSAPLITGVSWEDVRRWCRAHGYQIIAGDLAANTVYFDGDYAPKAALVVGSEGQGLSAVRREDVDLCVRIPLANGVESLNAAVAGGLLLYEIMRQRALATVGGNVV